MGQYARAGERFTTDANAVLNGGKVYFYQTGTGTAEDTYSDSAESVANPNPVILDSAGQFTHDVYFSTPKRITVKTSADVTVDGPIDDVLPISPIQGTFTPVLSDGTNNATASTASGFYSRIGDRVFYQGYIQLSSVGSVSGDLRITGLPFTQSANAHGPVHISYASGFTLAGGEVLTGVIGLGQNYITLMEWDTTGTTNASDADIGLTSSSLLLFDGVMII